MIFFWSASSAYYIFPGWKKKSITRTENDTMTNRSVCNMRVIDLNSNCCFQIKHLFAFSSQNSSFLVLFLLSLAKCCLMRDQVLTNSKRAFLRGKPFMTAAGAFRVIILVISSNFENNVVTVLSSDFFCRVLLKIQIVQLLNARPGCKKIARKSLASQLLHAKLPFILRLYSYC